MAINSVSSSANAVQIRPTTQPANAPVRRDADGDNDGTKTASTVRSEAVEAASLTADSAVGSRLNTRA